MNNIKTNKLIINQGDKILKKVIYAIKSYYYAK